MRNASNVASGIASSVWKPIKFGNGGFVTGIDISADGLRKVISTDVGGAWIKDSTDAEWRQLLTSATLPSADYDPIPNNGALADGFGTYGVALAPSNKAHIVVGFNAFLYRSTDGGATFARMALAAKRMNANTGAQRLWTTKIAYHPTDPNTIIVGTMGDGVFYTTNASTAGGTWTAVTISAGTATGDSVATPQLVCFDGGTPANVFISRYGTGVYRSTTGVTGAFTQITGGPTGPSTMFVDAGGTLWVVDALGGANNVWKLARGSSTWVNLTLAGRAQAFAVDPTTLTSIVCLGANGECSRSLDTGATWVNSSTWFDTFPAPIGTYTNAVKIPWQGSRFGAGFPSQIKFDPVATNKLWLAHGLGVSWSNPPSTYVRWDWYEESAGSSELGFTRCLSIPGNSRPLFSCYDKSIWRPKDLDVFSGKPIFPGATVETVDHAYDMDYGAGAPNFVAALVNFNNELSGYSTDGGATWTKFAAPHPLGSAGGALCCPGLGKIVWVPSNNGKGVYSTDYGATWNPLMIGGVQLGGWIHSIFIKRFPIAADKQRPGHIAMVLKNHADQDVTKAGVWTSADSGATSSKVFSGAIDTSSGADAGNYWQCDFDYIEGRAGELLYTGGQDFNSKLMYSANDGANWSILRSGEIDLVRRFGFGMGLPGRAYPGIVFAGQVSGVSGIYVSYDFFATTPSLLSRFPFGMIASVDAVYGDMNKIGRFYVAISGQGVLYCDIPDIAHAT